MLSRYINELRWIEYGDGMAFVQRSWMDGQAESSADWANMTANFYIGVVFPTSQWGNANDRCILGCHSAWEIFPFPEDIAKGQAIDGLKKNGEDLANWLSENDVPD